MGCGGRGTQEQALAESPWWVVGELTEVQPPITCLGITPGSL